MTNERSSLIVIGGEQHEMILTTRATKAISARYGGLDNLGDKLMKSENMEMALDEIIWLITLLCNQSIEIHNLKNSEKKPLLTEETVELLTSPGELAEYKDAITEAMLKGTKRNIESEDTSKNAVTAEGTMQNCSPGCSITERRSCTFLRKRCGLCRSVF